MGNHEYCEDCGENTFHHGSPCDPVKVAERKNRAAEAEARAATAVVRMRKKLDDCGIPYEMDGYNAVVKWRSYTKEHE